MARYIFLSGGVISGVGKGIATAAIGKILQSKGFRVTAIKIDPYVNIDAGTIRPTEHGEVFVTEDGTECDQDIGNYERFLDENIYDINYLTTGRIYLSVIQKERSFEYGGEDVEVVPHIPEEVISRIKNVATRTKADFVLVEIGGTVGEYQNILFLEAARLMKLRHPKDVLFVLVSYLPVPKSIGEMKTKPTQYAVRTLNSAGIQPDIIIARSDYPVDKKRKEKIATFCNVEIDDVISAPDVEVIYEIPLNFEKDKLGDKILKKFNLKAKKHNMKEWKNFVEKIKQLKKTVKIAIVGKYFGTGDFTLTDSYISVIEAIKHAAWSLNRVPEIFWLDAEKYEKNPKSIRELKNFKAIIVPGGFGSRGVEGKIKAIEFPFLGLCYGMQMAVVEFARNVCGLKGAHTTEVNPKTKYPVIDTIAEQAVNIKEKRIGGSMRLGAFTCEIKPNTKAFTAYGVKLVSERHRHRYEVNNNFRDILEKKGMIFSGINTERNLVEIIELKNHPFFVGTQFHPELKSRPLKPHPLYREFIKVAIQR